MKNFFFLLCATLAATASWGAQKPVQKPAPVRVACVGNSITYGMLVEDRERNCYPAVLGRMLGEGYEVRNFGHSGATLLNKGHNPYTKTKEYAEAIAFRPQIAIIHLGVNDTDPRNWPNYRDEFIPDYAALIESFRKADPEVKVYICRMTPIPHRHRRFKGGTRDWYNQIQEAIERVARTQGATLIDLEAVLKDRPELLPDAIHPNAEGARLLAERIYSAITGDYGKLKMSPIYTDNMVLQRGESTRIGGLANAGRLVTVTLADEAATAGKKGKSRRMPVGTVYATDTVTAGADGKWQLHLSLTEPLLSAMLTIATPDTTAVYRNVGVGEVWMASGQSNMSWPVVNAAERKEARPNANIRLFRTNPTFAQESNGKLDSTELLRLNQLDYIRNPKGWMPGSDTAAMEGFSAVAWFFGQMLSDSLGADVPIGLVETSLGGAPAEGFVARRMLENDPVLVDLLYNWRNNEMTQEWVRQVIQNNLKEVKDPQQRHYFEPAYLYESRTAPLAAGYDIRGTIWYQGESNAHFPELHERIFPAVVWSFRRAFDKPEMPFYFVQLSSLNRPSWPEFRNSQWQLGQDPLRMIGGDIGMAVCSDIGDSLDVHPRHKKPVGERLALLVLDADNDRRRDAYHSPQYQTVVRGENGAAVIRFDQPLTTEDGGELRTFELAGEDGIFHPATARIEGDKVIVTAAEITNPMYVRYGWQPYTRANLCGAGMHKLPVSTFKAPIFEK